MDNDLVISFSFPCRQNDVLRMKNLLSDLGMMELIASDGHIHGICEFNELKQLMNLLSKNPIAGIDQETELITKPHFSKRRQLRN
jgi:hypothetical protein